MRRRPVSNLLILIPSIVLVTVAATSAVGVGISPGVRRVSLSATQEVSFVLNKLPENPKQYSLVISDTDEHVISGSFSIDQLQILRAIMVEAAEFALTAEAVGGKEPITTRFKDKEEHAFIVDVQKMGTESSFFLTLKTESGRTTMNVGKTIRSTRREQGVFFDLLSRLESTLPKLPAQPGK